MLERGIGDDCALLRSAYDLVTTDASVEGVHFSLDLMTVADAAYRCLASNLSDMAAMGAVPGAFTLVLGLRPDLEESAIVGAIEALKACIAAHKLDACWLVGGDVVRSATTFFSVTLLGTRPQWPLVYRKGAMPDDLLLHIGELGRSGAGLALLRSGKAVPHKGSGAFWRNEASWGPWAPFVKAFCRPQALTQMGPALAKAGLAHAMMDSSDGLMMDLPRLLSQSTCGGIVDLDAFQPDPALLSAANCLSLDARDWMLSGGEDFGLIVAASRLDLDSIRDMAYDFGLPCRVIGRCTEGLTLNWMANGQMVVPNDHSFYHA